VGKRALKLTCWRLESRAAARADLAAHVASIFQRLPVERLTRQRALLPRDSQIALDIGVFNDRPITVVEIPNKILNELSGVGCKVEVTVYPISSAKRKEMGAHPKRKVKGHPPVK
jgi:hypothetical protein